MGTVATPAMTAPAVNYTTTPDGFRLAYTVAGEGYPVVVLPSWINHVQDVWAEGLSVANLLRDMSQGYEVIQYDSRGMGLSTRGLPESLSLDDYFIDLDTVLEETVPGRFVLVGFDRPAFLALRYAIRHPERVSALVLIGPPLRAPRAVWEDLARQDWDTFLADHVARGYDGATARRLFEMFRCWASPEDYLLSCRVWHEARIESPQPELRTPTLVLAARGFRPDEQRPVEFTSFLPNARLAYLESGLPYGGPGEAVQIIAPFLARNGIPAAPSRKGSRRDAETAGGLSGREIEVLRLIAEGKSNAGIAAALVISPNTVIRHVSNIFAKTGASNRTEAASFAHREGLA
jgi:pimeloyl-ACP methyl ester carboxylesterase/DNA-binding CsgD family transcriptional regulator